MPCMPFVKFCLMEIYEAPSKEISQLFVVSGVRTVSCSYFKKTLRTSTGAAPTNVFDGLAESCGSRLAELGQ